MHTVQLSIQDSAYQRFMGFINTFKNNEIELISEETIDKKNPIFLKHQKELQETLRKIEAGEGKFITIDELEESLDKIIAKYENKD